MREEALRLHGVFCEITGQVGLSLRFDRERVWFEWLRCGWGEPELREVVRYLRRGIAEGRRNAGALKFSNLIGQPDRFEEDLMEARRVLRPAKPRTQIVERTDGDIRRQVEVPVEKMPENAAEIFAEMMRENGVGRK